MKTTTIIDLMRHGETQGGHVFLGSTDTPLNEHGWLQMWNTVEKNSPGWDHIITSPLIRCAQFAQALAQRYTIPLIEDARVQELHFGQWEGHSAAELMQTDAAALTRFWQNPMQFTPPNAERLSDFNTRVLCAWHHIIDQYAGKKILLITHGGVIRTLLCHILQHPIERLLELEIEHAAMRRIRVKDGQSRHHSMPVTDISV